MSGILNSKNRIFDSIITQEGKAQISTGKLKAEYVSFSDMGAIYKLDTIVSGGLDQSYRICFESTNLPQDLIVFEADDSGRLLGNFLSGSDNYKVSSGQIFSGSVRDEGRSSVSGSQFNSLSGILLKNSLDNFKKLYILQSPNILDENHDQFLVFPKQTKFVITDNKPIKEKDIQEINIDFAESIFFDKRLSHVPNFKYLPPTNKARIGETQKTSLGNFANLSQAPILSFQDILTESSIAATNGFQETIYFTETSRENNLLCQFFEVSNGEMIKLDVIDFGLFPPDSDGISRHVFFAGKIYTDGFKTTTFINLFTLIWEG